jgi:hypothetical protein
LCLIFSIGSHKLFTWDWLRTAILLISASWVARITGVSDQYPATFFLYKLIILGYFVIVIEIWLTQASWKKRNFNNWLKLSGIWNPLLTFELGFEKWVWFGEDLGIERAIRAVKYTGYDNYLPIWLELMS